MGKGIADMPLILFISILGAVIVIIIIFFLGSKLWSLNPPKLI